MNETRVKVVWTVITIAIITLIGVAIGMGVSYRKLKTAPKDPRTDPLITLRSTMAASLNRPKINSENAMQVAEEVKTLPDLLEEAEKAYKKRKLKYQSFFLKGGKSSGRWDAFGRNLYYISKGKKSWYDAENFCESRDAHLASILTDEEQNFVTSLLSDPTWIGLTDEMEEGKWEWTDGSRFKKEYWSHNQPPHRQQNREIEEDCVSIVPASNKYNWKDAYCHEERRWVCKENLDIEEL
ncbi:C-type lectin domain family 4 member F-like [Podarcis raffonei]|uniref:C-type lectin domain family 4 member F-like n=1 Tax=Podarcis raffonei TaxID=65483 RepID=UPI00232998A8|nr:C-type lectin domain family 4 member F-like [Podarcis raffonei]